MNTLGFDDIVMASTEEEMHGDTYLCYQNRSTPLAMARLFDLSSASGNAQRVGHA